jgi:hypothetical protein
VEIGDDHVLRAKLVDAGGLDDDEALRAVHAGGVAKGVENEASADELEVGFEDFFAQSPKQHAVLFV